MTDIYAASQQQWVIDLLVGAGFAAFLAAAVRMLFRVFGGAGRA